MTLKMDAARRMVTKAEQRERAKVQAALRKWLPMRRAQLALETNADPRDAMLGEQLVEMLDAATVRDVAEAHDEEVVVVDASEAKS